MALVTISVVALTVCASTSPAAASCCPLESRRPCRVLVAELVVMRAPHILLRFSDRDVGKQERRVQ